jgi:hypothetical protein
MKSRIGFNHMDHELTTDAMKTRENMRHFDAEESLNSSQSRQYTDFMA